MIYGVDLPETNVGGGVGVVVEGIGVTSGLVRDNALAAGLVPGVFGAPGGDVLHVFGGSTVAGGASSRGTVSSAGVSEDEGYEKDQDQELHAL